MWRLALKSMLGDHSRLLISLLGVTFSIVLVNLQGRLLVGLLGKASLLVDYGQADIRVGRKYMNDAETGSTCTPERWITRIRGVEGVGRAEPYVLHNSTLPSGAFLRSHESASCFSCN